jgi:hypothetical protein
MNRSRWLRIRSTNCCRSSTERNSTKKRARRMWRRLYHSPSRRRWTATRRQGRIQRSCRMMLHPTQLPLGRRWRRATMLLDSSWLALYRRDSR